MKLKEIDKRIDFISKIAWLFIAIVPTIYLIWFYYINEYNISNKTNDWAAFGDFFGGVLNPIIAFCAFLWLAKSIRIQKQELEETRETFKESGETQKKQRFEDTFFALLGQHNVTLSNLMSNVSSQSTVKNGKVETIVQTKSIEEVKKKLFGKEITDMSSAKKILWENNELYGNYFRILYQVLKFIATDCPYSKVGKSFKSENILSAPVSAEEKTYSNIVRAFINEDVSQILAINCFCESEEDSFYKYKLLIERYSFLEHMPFDLDGKINYIFVEIASNYNVNAFGDSVYYSKNIKN